MYGMDLYSNISRYIDHSVLKPDLRYKDIEESCKKAIELRFASVCINPSFVKFASDILKNSVVKVCSVISFPFGLSTVKTKIDESIQAIEDGASELDIVWNITAYKSQDYNYIEKELREIEKATRGVIRKVIVETGYLTDEEKVRAIKMLIDTGIEFIKTSTGFNTTGATFSDVKLFKELANGKIKIKASGGIRDLDTFLRMVKLGAERIGTSSSFIIASEYLKSIDKRH